MKNLILLFYLLLISQIFYAQDNFFVEIGPMPAHYTDSTESYWFLLNTKQSKNQKLVSLNNHLEKLKNKKGVRDFKFKTEDLLGDRKIARVYLLKEKNNSNKDTISFLTGSCAFQYPFPLNAGGKRKRLNRIFSTMAAEKADFMVWTGDNVYYLAGQWNSYKSMVRENLRTRLRKSYKEFLESCPQYATWDDHDFGPNDSDGRFKLKDTAFAVFKKFWMNPYHGTDEQNGVFCHFSQGDCDFFMLDSRYHCDKKNKDKKLIGDTQLEWLKTQLKASKANFKFIFSGTQFIPIDQFGETWARYPNEHGNFFDFVEREAIKGLIFISGDRHYSELNKKNREKNYPLYEFTCSPLTSFTDPAYTKNNPIRIKDTSIRDQNYGRIKIFNEGRERICRIETFDTKGKFIWKYDIKLSELQN